MCRTVAWAASPSCHIKVQPPWGLELRLERRRWAGDRHHREKESTVTRPEETTNWLLRPFVAERRDHHKVTGQARIDLVRTPSLDVSPRKPDYCVTGVVCAEMHFALEILYSPASEDGYSVQYMPRSYRVGLREGFSRKLTSQLRLLRSSLG